MEMNECEQFVGYLGKRKKAKLMEMNEREEFIGFVCKTLNELKEQFIEKQQQYKTDADPLSNFRKGAALKRGQADMAGMYECAKDYALKHVAHVYGHDINGNKVEESLKDIAIYSVIELYMVEKQKKAVEATPKAMLDKADAIREEVRNLEVQ